MKRAKELYLAIIIICILIIAWSTYYTLGGFDTIEVFVMEGKERTIIGKEYTEKYSYKNIRERYEETKAAIDSNQLKGQVAIVFYEDSAPDSIHYFIGAYEDEIKEVLRLPAGYSYKEFRTNKVFKVFLTQHWMVAPDRDKIDEMMEIKAIEEASILQPFTFDLYYPDESRSTERWAKP